MKRIFYIWIFLFLSISFNAKSEGIGIGISTMYNFQTESFGAGFRFNFKPSNLFRVIPQAAYYPSFNKIHEYYAGLGLEINLFKIKKYNFYMLGQAGYNGWLNANESLMTGAKASNFVIEGGAGIVKNKGCVRPFLEYRYNGNWKETNLKLGLLFVFGCKKNAFGRSRGKRKAVSCPAYY
jgi:hypothetical protein